MSTFHPGLLEVLDRLPAGAMQERQCTLRRGEWLCRQDDAGDCLYVVRSGRLRAIRDHGKPSARVLGDVDRGECVGEMAFLSGERRSASVIALRDSELVAVDAAGFHAWAERSPGLSFAFMRLLVERMRRSYDPAPRLARTLALVPLNAAAAASGATDQVVRTLAALGPLQIFTEPPEASCDPSTPEGDARLAAWLDAREVTGTRLVLIGRCGENDAWTRRCLRQADLVLFLTPATGHPGLTELERILERDTPLDARPQRALVLWRKGGAIRGTAPWLAERPYPHYHISDDSPDGAARLARIVCGRGLSVALGGGGARGFGHIGFLRACQEAQLDIDHIGGTSIGAVLAAQFALGWSWQEMVAQNERQFVSRGRLNDYTFLPLFALIRGKRYLRALREMFGELDLADFARPCFAVTCNLSLSTVQVFRRGPAWKYLSASMAIPGIGPGMIEGGHLLVDGGLLDNNPVGIARELGPGHTIGVGVSPPVDLVVEGFSGRPTHRDMLRSLLGRTPRLPHLFSVLYRTAALSSTANKERNRRLADLFLELDMSDFKTFDWHRLHEAVATGHRQALEPVQAFAARAAAAAPEVLA